MEVSSSTIYIYKEFADYSDPSEALAAKTSSLNKKELFAELERGDYYVVIPSQQEDNNYEFFEVKISVECGNDAYGWSFDFNQCVVECDGEGASRRAKDELYTC